MASVVDKTTPRGTGGGKWKARLGIGRRNNNNNNNSNAATPVAANAAARHSNTTTSSSSNHTPPPEEADHGEARSLASSKRLQQQRIAASKQNAAKAHQHQHSQQRSNFMKKLNIKTSFRKSSQESRDASESPPSNPQSPISTSSFATVEVRKVKVPCHTLLSTISTMNLTFSFLSLFLLPFCTLVGIGKESISSR